MNGFEVKSVFPMYNYKILGASYAGCPRDNTMMYITSKVRYLINNLDNCKECICFISDDINVPESIKDKNAIILCSNPTYEYARFAKQVSYYYESRERDNDLKFQDGGYYIGSDVKIGKNAYIEPGAVIGHKVTIGKNAVIKSGAIIKHAIIGDNFLCNENAVIGGYSFTMAVDDDGNKFRIPSMGRVIIGNYVEVGANNNIAMGACGDTILEDYVKLDGLVYIGHEAYLRKNTEIAAGVIVAGFVEIGENSYLGINASIRNRICLGNNCVIGMGAVVTKSVEDKITVIGNPARTMG